MAKTKGVLKKMDGFFTYENPLITRYAGSNMAEIFSDHYRVRLWRRLWIALAESEMELGIAITQHQIDEMKRFCDDIDFETARQREREVRHDVMAHIYAFGKQASSAMPIIHLGATSCYVTDNAEIIMIRDALKIVKAKILCVLDKLKDFALKYKALPCLGFTHLQPAQLTTVGKRATLWMQELLMDLESIEGLQARIKMRGSKGTTGTQASFMSLFDNDSAKVKKLDELICKKMGFENSYCVTGQTYSRKFDYLVMSVLSQIAQSASKFANDLRILQSMKEVEEPFEKTQIGSSAMAYKRNPMRSERICALSRYVMSLPINQAITSSSQWFERTLDDSANKRITIPQAFLAIDGILNLYVNISENMVVYEKVILKHIVAELPFMVTENILMACVKAGKDRQEVHERIRELSMEASVAVKNEGAENDLIKRIKSDPMFDVILDKLDEILEPSAFIGRSVEQVEEFIENEISPKLQNESNSLNFNIKIEV